MKLDNIFNEGAVGIEQALYLGEIAYNTKDAAPASLSRTSSPKALL
jgi:hypothetical protein